MLTAVDEIIDDHVVGDATWSALASHFEPAEIFELLFLVGGYLCLAGVLNSIGLQSAMPSLPPGHAGLAPANVQRRSHSHVNTTEDDMATTEEEGVLDPWVAEWLETHPEPDWVTEGFPPEIRELARGPVGAPPTREIDHVSDETVDGVPIRIYRNEGVPTGLVVYIHGGAFTVGSIGIMDNVARELAHATGAVVVSVEYRLAPENPYPAGLDDSERVTRWALDNAGRFDVSPASVVLAGESAGGNLATAVALRLRDAGAVDGRRAGPDLPLHRRAGRVLSLAGPVRQRHLGLGLLRRGA